MNISRKIECNKIIIFNLALPFCISVTHTNTFALIVLPTIYISFKMINGLKKKYNLIHNEFSTIY